jgi:hypothetical protein
MRIDSEVRGRCVHGKTKLSLCELAHMEDSSFFREQAERCRRLARDSADPILEITLGTLADDCTAYAGELEDQGIAANYPDDDWFAIKAQTEMEPTWSAIRTILFGMLVTTPGIFALAWMLWKERVGL